MKKSKTIPSALWAIFEKVFPVMDDRISTTLMGRFVKEEYPTYNSRDGFLPLFLSKKCGQINPRTWDKRLPPISGKRKQQMQSIFSAQVSEPLSDTGFIKDTTSPVIFVTSDLVDECVRRKDLLPEQLKAICEAHGYVLAKATGLVAV